MVIADNIFDRNGNKVADKLIFSTICDGTIKKHLEEWYDENKKGMDEIFRHCIGYPLLEEHHQRIKWLRQNRQKESLFWPCKMGGTKEMIVNENILFGRIQTYLDSAYQSSNLSEKSSTEIYNNIKSFVQQQPDLQWTLKPEPKRNIFQWIFNFMFLYLIFNN